MPQSNRKRFIPTVEGLEGRLVPATFTVTTFADVVNPADGRLSLREAINLANATPAADTIVLQAGVYQVASPRKVLENGNAAGDFDITNPLTIVGQGASTTAVDGGRRERLFEAHGNIGVRFARMTLRNGAVNSNLEVNDGGAVRAAAASVRMDGCVVTDNRAARGGGISTDTGNVTLVGCVVSRNVANERGGGLSLGTGTLTLRGSVVRRNLAGTSGGGAFAGVASLTDSSLVGNSARDTGGGLRATTLTLLRGTVAGNSASAGGGVWASTATVINSAVQGNRASEDGGGLVAFGATFRNSTVSGNFAGSVGGGLFADVATMTNCTVSGNSAGKAGGGVFSGSGDLSSCTITDNIAGDGGGLVNSEGGRFTVKNTIIAQNLVRFTGQNPDVSGDFVSLGHNLIGLVRPVPAAVGGLGFGGNGDQVGTSENPLDAGLAPLALNGGRNMTHALLPGSRAIDRGDNAGAPAIDQRGVARRRDGDGNRVAVVDIGAFER